MDEDVAAALQQLARARGVSFKEVLNSSVRRGLAKEPGVAVPYRVPARTMGLRAGVDLDKALRLAGDLEDHELVRKLDLRK